MPSPINISTDKSSHPLAAVEIVSFIFLSGFRISATTFPRISAKSCIPPKIRLDKSVSFPCFLENPAPTQICTTNTSNESPIEIKRISIIPIDSPPPAGCYIYIM